MKSHLKLKIQQFLRAATRRNMQLVGVTGGLIAARFEEVYPPKTKHLAHLADKAQMPRDFMKKTWNACPIFVFVSYGKWERINKTKMTRK